MPPKDPEDPKPERGVDRGRSLPPVHYEVEINSVTKLLELDKYESGVFEAGGYEWSLCLHIPRRPDGKADDKGHMSLYLSMEEPNKLGDDERIMVDYKFFAFDYGSWTYVTFTEKGKEPRAFTKAKTKVGLPNFLSMKNFTEHKNEYVQDDHCIFGAEVMVSKSKRIMETLTIVKKPPSNPIPFKIQQFSTSSKHPQYSEAIEVGERKWKLKVFPQLIGERQEKWLSVYLQAQDLRPRIKIYVKATLKVWKRDKEDSRKEDSRKDSRKEDSRKDSRKEDSRKEEGMAVSGWLSDKKDDCGKPDFMPWKDLEESNGGFVNDNELKFQVKFLVISNVQRSDESV